MEYNWTFWFIIVIQIISTCFPLSLDGCNKPLGVSTGEIPDHCLTASSSHDLIVGPHRGRLGREDGGGAWCPRGMVDKSQKEYLEVDLESNPKIITGVGTQGRFANNFGVEFTPAFTIEYTSPKLDIFVPYSEPPGSNKTFIFTGNTDTYTEIKNEFKYPIFASRVRIRPISEHPRVVCLRMELYGCENHESLLYYKVEGKERKYHVGEGSLSDGIVLPTKEIKASILKSLTSNRTINESSKLETSLESLNSSTSPKEVISINDDDYSDVNEYYDEEWPDEYSEDNDLTEELPPGEVLLPETPLSIFFQFLCPRAFTRIHLYFDPVQPLLKGKKSVLTATLTASSDENETQPLPESFNFSIDSPFHNLSLSFVEKAQNVSILLSIEDAEVILQEVYFTAEPPDCHLDVRNDSPNENVAVHHPQISKKSYFNDPKLDSDGYIKKSVISMLGNPSNLRKQKYTNNNELQDESDAKTEFRETSDREIKKEISGKYYERIQRPEFRTYDFTHERRNSTNYGTEIYRKEVKKGKGTTTVWVVHTASTHRTYVGVAIGFSVGVVLLLTVWLWVWARSGRSKVSSPRFFRRSKPADTLDMTCLMEGSMVDWSCSSPLTSADESKDLQGFSLSSSLPKKEIKNKLDMESYGMPVPSSFGPYKISTITPANYRGTSSIHNYPLNYGFSLPKIKENHFFKSNSLFSRKKDPSFSLKNIKNSKKSKIQSVLRSSIYENASPPNSAFSQPFEADRDDNLACFPEDIKPWFSDFHNNTLH